jgi:outer membrane protein assembly factor BamB
MLLYLFFNLFLTGVSSFSMYDFSKVELDTIYKKSYERIISDVIFDTARVSFERAKLLGWKEKFLNGFSEKENLKIEYPKIILTSLKRGNIDFFSSDIKKSSSYVDEINFYDTNGSVIKSISLGWKEGNEYVFFSPEKKYLLLSKIPGDYLPGSSGATLYDDAGMEVGEIEEKVPVAVSDEGLIIGADLVAWRFPSEGGGSFYLYDKNGYLIREIVNPDRKKTVAFFAEFSTKGKYAVLAFTVPDSRPTYFYTIDRNGEIIGSINLPKFRFSNLKEEIVSSENRGFVVVLDKVFGNKLSFNGEQYLSFFDWEGNFKWEKSLEVRGRMMVKFSEDDSRLYVISNLGYLWCMDAQNGRIIWEYEKEPSQEFFLRKHLPRGFSQFGELEVKEKRVFVIAQVGKEWQSSVFFVFDGDSGDILKRKYYPGEKITFGETAEGVCLINISKASVAILE